MKRVDEPREVIFDAGETFLDEGVDCLFLGDLFGLEEGILLGLFAKGGRLFLDFGFKKGGDEEVVDFKTKRGEGF